LSLDTSYERGIPLAHAYTTVWDVKRGLWSLCYFLYLHEVFICFVLWFVVVVVVVVII
jgi:hypothetical protein